MHSMKKTKTECDDVTVTFNVHLLFIASSSSTGLGEGFINKLTAPQKTGLCFMAHICIIVFLCDNNELILYSSLEVEHVYNELQLEK